MVIGVLVVGLVGDVTAEAACREGGGGKDVGGDDGGKEGEVGGK